MKIKDNRVANTRVGMFIKSLASSVELIKLRYYKRNPLEIKALDVVSSVYKEERGSLISIIFKGYMPVVFSPGELMNLWQQSRILSDHGGAFAEVGVFRGASAKIISESKSDVNFYLFDTFEGLPGDIRDVDDRFWKGLFVSNEKLVEKRLANYPNIHIYKGFFPDSSTPIESVKFSFVHLDLDLYSSTKDALEFFYPRMLAGGRIISHDYGQCEGVWRAFGEFFQDKSEKLEPMEATQVLVIKK